MENYEPITSFGEDIAEIYDDVSQREDIMRWHPAGRSTVEGAVVALLCVVLLGTMWNKTRPLLSLAPHSA
jgi:hypothetical protein